WSFAKPALFEQHRLTWSVISQIRDLPSRPAHHSRIIFLNNPFEDWDVYFISELLWNDPTIQIRLANKMSPPPSAANLAGFDWILAFEGSNLRVLKARPL
ncbi:MAG: hypothetical protein ACRD30_06700, partial [Bryobacteraceae bacterium]